ncbi:Dihydrodipicolinate synthase [Microbotryomycetes sp. JL221]|nr:Dihydrodipicolinate synthase [Microbotryomycetes sp. JL221]
MSSLPSDPSSTLQRVLHSLHFDNPINLVLLLICTMLVIRLLPLSLLFSSSTVSIPTHPLPSSPDKSYNWRPLRHSTLDSLVWKTWNPIQLRAYDGTNQELDKGRILFAIRRKVYDVSSGRGFYGPGGPYAIFAGRDASRGLAKQSFEPEMLTPIDEPIDDLKDLSSSDWDNLKDWEVTLYHLELYGYENQLVLLFVHHVKTQFLLRFLSHLISILSTRRFSYPDQFADTSFSNAYPLILVKKHFNFSGENS